MIGVVPDDEDIVISTNRGETVAGQDSLSGRAFQNISRRLMGEEVPYLDIQGKKRFWNRLFRK
jgi:septum site-determining protein MinD